METEVELDLIGIQHTIEDQTEHIDQHVQLATGTTDADERARHWSAAAGNYRGLLDRIGLVIDHLLDKFPASWGCEGCGRPVGGDVSSDPLGGRWHPQCLQLFRCHVSDGAVEDEAFEFLRRRIQREASGSGGGVA